jgi:hypothetical protein
MMIEGSGSIHLTSGSGSGRPKNTWIRIRNTVRKCLHPVVLHTSILTPLLSPAVWESPVQLCIVCRLSFKMFTVLAFFTVLGIRFHASTTLVVEKVSHLASNLAAFCRKFMGSSAFLVARLVSATS